MESVTTIPQQVSEKALFETFLFYFMSSVSASRFHYQSYSWNSSASIARRWKKKMPLNRFPELRAGTLHNEERKTKIIICIMWPKNLFWCSTKKVKPSREELFKLINSPRLEQSGEKKTENDSGVKKVKMHIKWTFWKRLECATMMRSSR